MNLVFVWPLRHAGLALAIGLGACCNGVLLYRGLRARGIYSPRPGWPVFLLKLGVALLAMSAVLWFAAGAAESWLAAGAAARAARLTGVIALGAATYFAALWLVGFRLADFSKRV
jgi:putative peptidoglycan lipid II flippase